MFYDEIAIDRYFESMEAIISRLCNATVDLSKHLIQ